MTTPPDRPRPPSRDEEPSDHERDLALLIQDELRDLAARVLKRERPGHTLQTTALLDEVWLRLSGQKRVDTEDRARFFSLAALTMRRILVDHERARSRLKRGGRSAPITLTSEVPIHEKPHPVDLLLLDEALEELSQLSRRRCKIVEMRFFAGLSPGEVADILEVSERTVAREWALAKVWLRSRLDAAS